MPETADACGGCSMRIRHYSKGKFYLIECPEGSRVIDHDRVVVPFEGEDIRIPADPPELLPLQAESEQFGLTLIGKPEPDVRLAGLSCPACGESDVAWLRPDDAGEVVTCEGCWNAFAAAPVPVATRPETGI